MWPLFSRFAVDRLYRYRYKYGVKAIVFLGSSLAHIRAFPGGARREAGYQLDRVQRGLDPDDWKPLTSVGHGVREIRVRDASGTYRVVYVAMFRDAIYVLHAFVKKSQKTPAGDLNLAAARLKELKRRVE
jgi:phage-related protein